MRLEKQGIQLSKEVLREFYRNTSWYIDLEKAKEEAELKGFADWKPLVKPPPPLAPDLKTLVSEMYQALVNDIVEVKVFPCPSLDQVVKGMAVYLQGASS